MTTGFYSHESCFWHFGGQYAAVLPLGGYVQPMIAGGLPENPETKRRLKNLIEVTGLSAELEMLSAPPITVEHAARVHDTAYLAEFKRLSDNGGGEMGLRAPFGPGGHEIALQSAGLAVEAVSAVLDGRLSNAYALSRPPGHHCERAAPMGFCLLNNIAIAIEQARQSNPGLRVAVLDWDVHHGNGTEAIYIEDPDILTVSIHQNNNFPLDRGGADVRGEGPGQGANLNIPLPPGGGHDLYLYAMERLALPAIRAHRPDLIIVACGFDAGVLDPLSRMVLGSHSFAAMTTMVKAEAEALCGGRLVLVHEGGYSEVHVPFCGHKVLEVLSEARTVIDDPLDLRGRTQQPSERVTAFFKTLIDEQVDALV